MSFKSLTVGSVRNGVLLFLRERRFKVALSQMQFGELVISSVAEGLGDRQAGNKQEYLV